MPTSNLYGRNFANESWFKDTVAGNFLVGPSGLTVTAARGLYLDPTVSEIMGATQDYVLSFATPVKNAGGQTIGVWVNFAGFDLVEDILGSFYAGLVKQGEFNAEITLLDRSCTVLVDYDLSIQGRTAYVRDFEVIGQAQFGYGRRCCSSGGLKGRERRHVRHARPQASPAGRWV